MRKEAYLYRKLKKDYVQCLECEHYCAIPPGGKGRCGVKRNIGGKLMLVVYGRPVAVHVDPVEKKPLFHFLPGGSVFSIGTFGCNFTCKFCQNWEISQVRDFDDQRDYIGEDWPPEKIVDYCRRRSIPMIAYTYNEPIVFFEYAYDTAKLAHQYGIRNIFVSSGFETEQAIDMIEPYLDAANIDLKSFSDRFYREISGARLKPVLRNIEYMVKKTRIWVEVTTLFIPGLNDSPEEMRDIAQFLVGISPDLPWHVSAFYPTYLMTDRPPTPPETLLRAYEIGKEAGLHYVYVGNILSPEHEATYCPHCGAPVIKRFGYHTQVLWREPGVCPVCGHRLAGVWE